MTVCTEPKWFNNKTKLALSFFIWPLFLFGLYKTSLISTKGKWLVVGGFCLLLFMGSLVPASIEGRYDLVVSQNDEYLFGDILRKQNAYFEINEDKSIRYHIESSSFGTINRWGRYSYDEGSGTLTINWEDGQGPYSLKLTSNSFTIGETRYEK